MTGMAPSNAFALVGEAADQEVRRVGQLAAVRVDDAQHRDHALLGEGAAVLEVHLGHAADGLRVDVDVAGGDLADDLGVPVDEVDDDAVLGDDHVVLRRRRWRSPGRRSPGGGATRRGPASRSSGFTML